MVQLTMDLESSAEMMGIKPEVFLEFVKKEHLEGVIDLNGGWRISIFTLARLLNTTPQVLLGVLEDHALGQMMEEVADDECFEAEEGWQVYQTYLTETPKSHGKSAIPELFIKNWLNYPQKLGNKLRRSPLG